MLAPCLGDHQHAFLRFAQEHFVGAQCLGSARNRVEIELDAIARPVCHFDRRRGQAGRAHVLDARQAIGRKDFQASFEEQFLHEGVAHLNGRELAVGFFAKLGARHGGAMNSVSTCLGADVDDRVADAFRDAEEEVFGLGNAHRKRVDQDVPVVARIELHFTAHRRDADAVAVAADARDHALDQLRSLRVIGAPKSEGVQRCHRTRAHREHVAQDAADTRRRALVRLDVRRMVVRLHLEHRAETIPDVDRAGVFARPLNHLRAGRRQASEVNARRLVRAVLRPHHADDPELCVARQAGEGAQDPFPFLRR